MRRTIPICVFLLAFLPGCLARVMRGPALDHAVQVQAVAQSCEADGYGEGKCTQEDLEMMEAQAMCIMLITKGQTCPE